MAGGTSEEFEGLQSTEVLILGDWSEWQFAADLPGPKVKSLNNSRNLVNFYLLPGVPELS